ncbi:hypothetical protein Bca101_065260 [Brassica carinata]
MVSFGKCFFLVLLCLALLMSPKPAEAKIGIEPIGLCSKIPDCNQKCQELKKNAIGGICYRRSPRDTEDTCGCFIRISYIAS